MKDELMLASASFLYRALTNMPCACTLKWDGNSGPQKIVKECQRCKAMHQWEQVNGLPSTQAYPYAN